MQTRQAELTRRNMFTLVGAATAALTVASIGVSPATEMSQKAKAGLFSTDVGKGTHVLLLHGWACGSNDWIWQLPVLESRYRVVSMDLRGHGASEVMPSGSYRPDDYLADVERFISTKYPGKKFIVIGHSMGGQIAARLAARRPDLVRAVVSVDGSLGFPESLRPVFQKTTDDLASGDPGVVGPAMFEGFYDAATPPAFKRWHARSIQGMAAGAALPAVRESFGPLFLGARQVGLGARSESFCKGLTVPVYHLCRSADQAQTMSTWFSNPKSKVEFWTNAGHWIHQDRPADVNAALTAWIDAL